MEISLKTRTKTTIRSSNPLLGIHPEKTVFGVGGRLRREGTFALIRWQEPPV